MDPEACLEEALAIAADFVNGYGGDPTRLAELVVSLDRWMAGGGFMPARWQADDRALRSWTRANLERIASASAVTRMECAVQESARRELDARNRERAGHTTTPTGPAGGEDGSR